MVGEVEDLGPPRPFAGAERRWEGEVETKLASVDGEVAIVGVRAAAEAGLNVAVVDGRVALVEAGNIGVAPLIVAGSVGEGHLIVVGSVGEARSIASECL